MSAAWIITIEEQMESRLVRLPAWSRRSARACADGVVVLLKVMECSRFFKVGRAMIFELSKKGTNVQHKNFQTIQTKDLHAMKFFADKEWQRGLHHQKVGRVPSLGKQKTHLFVEFVGIPDTDSVPETTKNGGDFPTWDLSPFFQRKCWWEGDFFDCLLSNLSHPFYTCWFGSPVGSQLYHPSDELKNQ